MATDHLRGSGTYDSSLFCSLFLNSSVKELLNWCTFNNNINGIFLSNGIFQSKRSGHPKHSVKSTKGKPGGRSGLAVIAARRTTSLDPRSNYELFNCNNFNIRYWSWNYCGCWHQTCPPVDPR